MTGYDVAYRLGFTPWERYARVAAGSIGRLLDREEAERGRPPGRAVDLGCGRGVYAVELARRGWDAVGVDATPRAIEAARRVDVPGLRFVVGDVTDLAPGDLGTFDLVLDVGCFQGLRAGQRLAEGRSASALANPGATLLLLTFGPSLRFAVGGASTADVRAAFAGWELVAVEPAETQGLGWPLTTTLPRWYRLRRS